MRTTGVTQWARNGIVDGKEGFTPPSSAFIHFGEIYYKTTTTSSDLGTYLITFPKTGSGDTIEFTVARQGKSRQPNILTANKSLYYCTQLML